MSRELDNGDDAWEVFWCFNQWHLLFDKVKEKLPAWAYMRMVDDSKPLEDQVANARVLIPTTGVVDGKAIRSAAKLQLIVQPASGHNNIDIEAAAELGVPVCTSPGVNAASVAESALMMMLMLAKRVLEQGVTFQERGLGQPLGMRMAGKTLGVIGMGAIGKRLARAAEALDMRVLPVTSRTPRSEFEAVLRASHFVSLHCPLTPATRGLLGAHELALMPPGAMLINYARGEVLDKQALLEALKSGHLGGAGLDVHWQEPADPDDPIYRHPNVIATPHTGVCTHDVVDAYATLLCETIQRRYDGRELLHRLV